MYIRGIRIDLKVDFRREFKSKTCVIRGSFQLLKWLIRRKNWNWFFLWTKRITAIIRSCKRNLILKTNNPHAVEFFVIIKRSTAPPQRTQMVKNSGCFCIISLLKECFVRTIFTIWKTNRKLKYLETIFLHFIPCVCFFVLRQIHVLLNGTKKKCKEFLILRTFFPTRTNKTIYPTENHFFFSLSPSLVLIPISECFLLTQVSEMYHHTIHDHKCSASKKQDVQNSFRIAFYCI